VAQIDAPRAISELVQVGPVRDQTEWMLAILGDPKRTGLVVVTTPEEMPITETVELVGKVRASTDVDVAAVFANRVLAQWFEPQQQAVFDRLCEAAPQALLLEAAGAKVATVFQAAQLAESRRAIATEYLARLRDSLPADVPVHEIPELFTKASGRRVVSLVADQLRTELP
jgi:anion-transporting  ArsA/GET3 family ATPase